MMRCIFSSLHSTNTSGTRHCAGCWKYKRILASNFPSLVVGKAGFYVPRHSSHSLKSEQDFQWAELGQDEGENPRVCIWWAYMLGRSVLPSHVREQRSPGWHSVVGIFAFLDLSRPLFHCHHLLFLNDFPSNSGCC